jgi:EAL domain-containing protein (putative c-di-GMP-specific phosphodiesterase class I)
VQHLRRVASPGDSDAVELYQLGCEYAKGLAFGEPMDADAAMLLLTEERLEAAS